MFFLVVWCLVLPNRWALVASTDCFYGSVSTCSRSAVWRRETREKSGGMSLLDNMRREIKISIWLFFIFLFLSLSLSLFCSFLFCRCYALFFPSAAFWCVLPLHSLCILFHPLYRCATAFFLLQYVTGICGFILFFSFNLLLMLNVLCFRLLFWLCFCDVFF